MNLERRPLIALACLLMLSAASLLIKGGVYGWTIFALVPLFLGAMAAAFFRTETAGGAAGVGALAVTIALASLLFIRLEGIVCIAMCLPLAAPLGALGGLLVHSLRHSKIPARGASMLLLLPMASLTWDFNAVPTIFEVRSQVTVAASPEQVWKHVVTFSDLPAPNDWFFQAGLAYPKRARIEGTGPGAIRYCEFSTGPFVEPIVTWDEPHLLAFRVTENPAPMNEWSPYAKVLPKHLHGYFESKRGQFKLTRLPDGQTLLEGATWYQHGLWPAQYWKWWSQAIIHRIHLRVLNHVKMLAERET